MSALSLEYKLTLLVLIGRLYFYPKQNVSEILTTRYIKGVSFTKLKKESYYFVLISIHVCSVTRV